MLAFGIDAWWDGRQEREEEREALLGLQADFNANRSQLLSVIANHYNADQRLAHLESMSDQQRAALPFDSVQPYLIALNIVRTFDARDGTLDGLIASGRLGIISDGRLREALVEWKSEVEDLAEEGSDLRAAGADIRARAAELGGPWRGTVGGWERDPSQAPPLARARLRLPRGDLALIGGDRELMRHARVKRQLAHGYLAQMEPLAPQVDSVVALIEANLH